MKKIFTISFFIVIIFNGCATLFGGGGQQAIYVSGNTDKNMKATVKYSDGSRSQYVTIPETIFVNRKQQDLIIESTDDEFDTYIVASELNPYFVPNFLGSIFGFTSTAIDLQNGAMWSYDESVIVNEQ